MTLLLERHDVERFRSFVSGRLGLHFDDGKLDDLTEYLRRRVEFSGLREPGHYLARLDAPSGSQDEIRAIVEELTVGETYFFRNPNHFRAVAEKALPDCLAAADGRPLRILSAGCASGEEAYTLAIVLREAIPASEARAARIVGVDINPAFLERARAGRFPPWSLRATPPEAQRAWFTSEGRHFLIDEEIRAAVTFEERNLIGSDPDFWAPGAFDLIFCRNVLIYFSQEAIRATIARFARALSPGGFLFLGDAENLRGVSQDFHLHHTHDTFYYQVRAGNTQPARSPFLPVVPASLAAWSAEPDDSWVSAIHAAAERISRLARGSPSAGPPDAGAAPVTPPLSETAQTWDLSPTLQLLYQERYAEAAEALQALPAHAQKDPDAQLLRAVLLTNLGDIGEARSACQRVLDLDEFNAGGHYLLALCDEHIGDLAAASRHDHMALYLDPSFAMPRLHLGRLAKRQGDIAAAREELARALDVLRREDMSRILLFGGGFKRDALIQLCRMELSACGGEA